MWVFDFVKSQFERRNLTKEHEVTFSGKAIKQWDIWDESIHGAEGQADRIQRSATQYLPVIRHSRGGIALVQGSQGDSIYRVTLDECSCTDFALRRLPCKHMYRLATACGCFDQTPYLSEQDLEAAKVLAQSKAPMVDIDTERADVLMKPSLAPSVLNLATRTYHYHDVNIWVAWQYGGHYGKDCKSAGMKRGDSIQLVSKAEPDDKEAVVVRWKGKTIGSMKSNRLRGMVRKWKSSRLPIYCAISGVGGKGNLYLEIAFYGMPKQKK